MSHDAALMYEDSQECKYFLELKVLSIRVVQIDLLSIKVANMLHNIGIV